MDIDIAKLKQCVSTWASTLTESEYISLVHALLVSINIIVIMILLFNFLIPIIIPLHGWTIMSNGKLNFLKLLI